jgi:20S proteasome subunit alpha 7
MFYSIHTAHDDSKDREFELELSWVCTETGGKHEAVPKELLEEAERAAKDAMRDEMED